MHYEYCQAKKLFKIMVIIYKNRQINQKPYSWDGYCTYKCIFHKAHPIFFSVNT